MALPPTPPCSRKGGGHASTPNLHAQERLPNAFELHLGGHSAAAGARATTRPFKPRLPSPGNPTPPVLHEHPRRMDRGACDGRSVAHAAMIKPSTRGSPPQNNNWCRRTVAR